MLYYSYYNQINGIRWSLFERMVNKGSIKLVRKTEYWLSEAVMLVWTYRILDEWIELLQRLQ